MKKLLTLIAVVLASSGLTACFDSSTPDKDDSYTENEQTKETYTVTYVVTDGSTNSTTTTVTQDSTFTMEVPTLDDQGELSFVGWFTEDEAEGTQLTNELGSGLVNWEINEDTTVYAHFAKVELSYELLSDGTYAVYGATDGSEITNLYIPQYYNGNLITKVGSDLGSFNNYSNLVELSFYDTVEEVTLEAFNNLYIIKNYTVLNTDNRFANYCSIDGVIYDASVETLVKYPIGNPRIAYTMESTVKTIETNAFYNTATGSTTTDRYTEKANYQRNGYYSKLEELVFSDNLELIKKSAFHNTGHLQILTFSSNPTAGVDLVIEEYAFYNCRMLELELPSNLVYIGDYAFWGEMHYMYYTTTSAGATNFDFERSALVLPEGLTYIGSYAFRYCSWANEVQIASSVEEIGTYAFQSSGKITKIEFASNSKLTHLSEYVFASCTSVTELILPDSLEYIDSYAISSMTALTYLELPASLRYINSDGIRCSNLAEIKINEGLVELGDYAFRNCYKLTTINLPDTLTKIGESVFAGCSALSINNITISDSGLLSIVDDVLYGNNGTSILLYANTTNTSYTVPSGVTEISGSLFKGNTVLTEIILPEGLTSIGASAFSGCTSLTSIVLPSTVTSIGEYAFQSSGITSITIPASVETIGMRAFWTATSLEEVIFEDGSKVTNFASNLFYGCTSLSSITWPSNLQTMEFNAFASTGFTSIEIPNTVTYMERNIFEGCLNLTSITLPSSLKSIEYNIVNGCYNLTNVIVDENSTSFKVVDGNLYSYDGTILYAYIQGANIGVTEFVVPEGVTTIYSGAFNGVTSLTSIEFASSVTTINYTAFYNSKNITSITLNSQTQLDLYSGTDAYTWTYCYLSSLETIYVVEGLSYSSTEITSDFEKTNTVDGYDVFTLITE